KAIPNESQYEKFLRQHFVRKMNPNQCDTMMKLRKIYGDKKMTCKVTNTFIAKTTKKNLKKVCLNDGKAYNNKKNLHISNKPFSLITCKLKGNSQNRPCSYRGSASYGKIVIACEKNLPVHFEREHLKINR
uniref:Ribonuclease like 3 n=1 Tax=Scleropages formosus TaxID=113540 RepID=A0A8C9QTI8_SCLFO